MLVIYFPLYVVLFGWCCPLCLICKNAQDMEENVCMFCVLGWCVPPAAIFLLRQKIREKEGIEVRYDY